MKLKSERSIMILAIALTTSAIRATLLARVWILLAIGLIADNFATALIGLNRHAVAQRWSSELIAMLPSSLHEFVDKAWVGPLGLAAPFLNLTEAHDFHDILLAILGIIVTLSIWGLIGSAICRIAVTRIADVPIPGVRSSIRYVVQQRITILGAICMPICLIIIMSTIVLLMGLVTKIPYVGPIAAWIMLPLSLIPAVTLLMTLLSCIFGWPMIMGAAVTEGDDMFDALSRSQCYLFQAPVSWALTLKVGILMQAIGYASIQAVSWALICILSSSFHDSRLTARPFEFKWFSKLPAPWTMPEISSNAFSTWISIITHLAASWPIGFAFVFPAAIYLTLRNRVDGIAPTEVYWPGKPEGEFAGRI